MKIKNIMIAALILLAFTGMAGAQDNEHEMDVLRHADCKAFASFQCRVAHGRDKGNDMDEYLDEISDSNMAPELKRLYKAVVRDTYKEKDMSAAEICRLISCNK